MAKQNGWQPTFTLNLTKSMTAKAFEEFVEKFETWAKKQDRTSLGLACGWYDMTPQLAEQFLIRNGMNRKASHDQVQFYGEQMLDDNWPATGQPIIFDTTGLMQDGQHRAWACYLSGKTIRTYIVADVEAIPNLFAYIDNNKARTPAEIIGTGGLNGVSPMMANIISMDYAYSHGGFQIYPTTGKFGGRKVRKLANHQVHQISQERPMVQRAAHLMAGEYHEVQELTNHATVNGFVALKILEAYGEDVLDEFMSDLIMDEPQNAIVALLRKQFVEGKIFVPVLNKMHQKVTKVQALANFIIAFQLFITGAPAPKKFKMDVNEFPKFPIPSEQAEAAE